MYKKYFFVIALLLAKSVLAEENAVMPLGFGNQAVTREVAEYTLKEQNLMAAIQANKENSLAEGFEVWMNNSGDWQSKTEWLKAAKQQTNFNPQNLSVRFMDDFAAVSFSIESDKKKHQKSEHFVVDIWRKSTNQLTVRYISDAKPANTSALQNRKF